MNNKLNKFDVAILDLKISPNFIAEAKFSENSHQDHGTGLKYENFMMNKPLSNCGLVSMIGMKAL